MHSARGYISLYKNKTHTHKDSPMHTVCQVLVIQVRIFSVHRLCNELKSHHIAGCVTANLHLTGFIKRYLIPGPIHTLYGRVVNCESC